MIHLKILDNNLLGNVHLLDNNQLWRIRCNVQIYPLKQENSVKSSLETGIKAQRSYRLFKSVINSQRTFEKYDYGLTKFLIKFKIKDYDTLINLDVESRQEILENYVMELKGKNLKRSTVKNYLAPMELLLDVNKKVYFKKALHMHFPKDIEKIGNEKPYLNEDIQKILSSTTSKKKKAFIHFLASTGARPAVLQDPILRFKHVTPMSFGCKALRLYDDSNEEYWGFLTPEASTALDDYVDQRINLGERITQDSPIFVVREKQKTYDPQNVLPLTSRTAYSWCTETIKKSGVERIKRGNRYDKALFYGFRKRFNTILKLDSEINSNIAEKLMAHKKGLDGVYFKPTKDECFKEFVKAIPELTVSESEKLKLRIDSLTEDTQIVINQYEERIARTEKLLSKVLERLDSK